VAEEIGMAMRVARVRQKKTLKEVAHKAGINYSLLSQIELGRINPRADEISRICKALNLSVEEVQRAATSQPPG
jgi:transcriptional regulator with XRE-family HTH domain